jgi:antitoxin component YwqK of YwqJK toxin-antitoxin module
MRRCSWVALIVTLASASGHARPVTVVERFFPDGRRESLEFYRDGQKTGHHEFWWPNGALRVSASYAHDAYHGEVRTWDAHGHAYELRHFDRGREAGLQQSWNEDGTLFLNYVVKDGRRFGYLNAHPCQPPTPTEGGRP